MVIYEEVGRRGFPAAAVEHLNSDYPEMEEFEQLASSPCSAETREAITKVRRIANPNYSPGVSSSSPPAASVPLRKPD